MSKPIVVIVCMAGSSESWEPQQRPHPWHRCAGGGAVHSIKLGRSLRRRGQGYWQAPRYPKPSSIELGSAERSEDLDLDCPVHLFQRWARACPRASCLIASRSGFPCSVTGIFLIAITTNGAAASGPCSSAIVVRQACGSIDT